MRTISATEAARRFSKLLSSLEHGGEEVVIVRNNHPVARLVPGASRMTAVEALSDLHESLDYAEGENWLTDIRSNRRMLAAEKRDPWA